MPVCLPVNRRRFFHAFAAALPLSPLTRAQSAAEVLIAAMQDGGKVIYLRHAATNPREVDTGRLGDRGGQRNLSAEGVRQAQDLGRALRALRVPLNDILASPVPRFPDSVLPEGAMAVFLPGRTPELLGTLTAARVIAAATARGALPVTPASAGSAAP